ncbi:Lsr2 family protein [Plantibacter sp. VKM Ac-2876]|uniref:histone-like nucleoid-structuring protein Lsr2 n=1 Tax=Plantibacter sp. VKM Ac-2876 TaxID=2783826 RepID=UPI00188CD5C6|nr:Lsr2 family protein [Plantibacter sp. VKM Ac-2876]MBF4563943.1 Lsr2 family protein [Plantibacter sp. VKM Ac-2876]
MAQKVVTTLVDDLDGSELKQGEGKTVAFALDGSTYEIDLSEKNEKALREALEPYLKAARSTSRAKASSSASSARSNKEELAAARSWLRANGHDVSDRGRIPSALLEKFRAAAK